jgi:glycosyltransferase involved in cell wall biosynthesis
VSGYLREFDVCLLPNQRKVFAHGAKEGGIDIGAYTSPLKMFEYMAHAKPIIASNLPVIREILNEENSLLVGCDDFEAWARAIRQLSSPELRGQLGKRAYRDFEQRYTWSARAASVLAD